MKKILYLSSLLFCAFSFISCGDDKEEEKEFLFSVADSECLLFNNVEDAIKHASSGNHYLFFNKGELYIRYIKSINYEGEELFGRVHKFSNTGTIPDTGRAIRISGDFYKSNNAYSIVPEDLSVDLYISKVKLVY